MMEHVRAAVIDLDGTLLDTAPDFHAAINAMRAEFALAPLDVATIVSFVGKGSENLVRRVLAQDFDDNAVTRHLEQAMDAYQRHYLAINGLYSRLYPAVVEGLQALRDKGLRLACVTNKPMAFCVPLLEKMGLRGYFEVVYGGDSFATRKPDPAPVLAVCRDFELSPAEVIVIGDSVNDAMAARAAGCRVLLLPYGYNHGESVHDADCDGIVESILAASQLIR
jgi:phosphoglycolate phosphatase